MILASRYKIRKGKRFDEIKKDGKLIQSESFGVVYLKRDDDSYPRFAFIVSTKISKLAVHRNRINRAMNEGVRRNIKKVPKGYDFLFLAKRELAKMTTDKILKEIDKFFSDLNLD